MACACRKYGLRVAVLNDFEAAGYGITVISQNDYVVLNNVPAAPQASPAAAMLVSAQSTTSNTAQALYEHSIRLFF